MRFLVALLLVAPRCGFAGLFDTPPEFNSGVWSIDAQDISDCVEETWEASPSHFEYKALKNCVGLAAQRCLDDSDVGDDGIYDRRSYLACSGLEARYWEWRLSVVVDGLSGGWSPPAQDTEFFMQAADLQVTVILWRAFREARCTFASSSYGKGSSRGREGDIVEGSCVAHEAAAFALDMEAQLRSVCATQKGERYGDVCDFEVVKRYQRQPTRFSIENMPVSSC